MHIVIYYQQGHYIFYLPRREKTFSDFMKQWLNIIFSVSELFPHKSLDEIWSRFDMFMLYYEL